MANATIQPALLTRPNNTTAYAVGDGIAALTASAVLQEIPNFAAGANGTAFLTGFEVTTSQKANQAMVRVHFYSANTVSAAGIIEDNAVFPLLVADQLLHQGFIDLPAFATGDTTSTYAITFLDGLSKSMKADSNGSLWFQYQLINQVFTPDALQTFQATVSVVQ